MDIFSHGLWAGAVFHEAKFRGKNMGAVLWGAFWGVFPDFLSFAPLFIWLIFGLLTGEVSPGQVPQPDAAEPAMTDTLFIHKLTSTLYNLTHSLVILMAVVGLAYLIFKKKALVLAGWLIHILIDIPTHSYKFYPTPFLWPLSGYKFDGVSWGQPVVMILDVILLVILYGWIIWRWRRKKAK